MNKDVPVGARWRAENSVGKLEIWLHHKGKNYQQWFWSFEYSDGSGYRCDWGSSYRVCYKECIGKLRDGSGKYPRFKRVKE